MNLIFEIVDFNFSYDSVDKAILANPHTFNKISYSVEKYLSSAVSTIDTYTSTSSASGKFPIFQGVPHFIPPPYMQTSSASDKFSIYQGVPHFLPPPCMQMSSASGKFSIYQVELSLKFL